MPYRIIDRGTYVDIAYGIAPFVGGDEVAAGETIDSGMELLQRVDHFLAETVDVVCGHQRNSSNVKRACASASDFEPRIVAIDFGNEVEREFTVSGADRRNIDCLPVARFLAPDERYFH